MQTSKHSPSGSIQEHKLFFRYPFIAYAHAQQAYFQAFYREVWELKRLIVSDFESGTILFVFYIGSGLWGQQWLDAPYLIRNITQEGIFADHNIDKAAEFTTVCAGH